MESFSGFFFRYLLALMLTTRKLYTR